MSSSSCPSQCPLCDTMNLKVLLQFRSNIMHFLLSSITKYITNSLQFLCNCHLNAFLLWSLGCHIFLKTIPFSRWNSVALCVSQALRVLRKLQNLAPLLTPKHVLVHSLENSSVDYIHAVPCTNPGFVSYASSRHLLSRVEHQRWRRSGAERQQAVHSADVC